MRKILVIPDTHAPYHDHKAFNLALRVGKAFAPDLVVILGDFVDCYSISRFPKLHRASFQQEIRTASEMLRKVESLKAAKNVFIEGNHEARWPKYIADNAPDAFGLFPSMRALLGLDKWTYIPYRESFYLGDGEFTHDTGAYGSTAHVRAAHEAGSSICIGHTHFAGVEYRGHRNRNVYFGAALGCLADKSKIDYQSRVKTTHWTHGVGLGYLVGEKVHLNFCPFILGKAVVEGKVVS